MWPMCARQAAIAGRDPRKLFTYNLVTVIVDETDAKAQAKFDDYRQYASYDGALVFMSGWSGIDFGQYAPTDLVKKERPTPSFRRRPSGRRRQGPGRSRSLRAGAALAVLGPSSSARRRRSPTFCRNGSRRRTSTASTSPTR